MAGTDEEELRVKASYDRSQLSEGLTADQTQLREVQAAGVAAGEGIAAGMRQPVVAMSELERAGMLANKAIIALGQASPKQLPAALEAAKAAVANLATHGAAATVEVKNLSAAIDIYAQKIRAIPPIPPIPATVPTSLNATTEAAKGASAAASSGILTFGGLSKELDATTLSTVRMLGGFFLIREAFMLGEFVGKSFLEMMKAFGVDVGGAITKATEPIADFVFGVKEMSGQMLMSKLTFEGWRQAAFDARMEAVALRNHLEQSVPAFKAHEAEVQHVAAALHQLGVTSFEQQHLVRTTAQVWADAAIVLKNELVKAIQDGTLNLEKLTQADKDNVNAAITLGIQAETTARGLDAVSKAGRRNQEDLVELQAIVQKMTHSQEEWNAGIDLAGPRLLALASALEKAGIPLREQGPEIEKAVIALRNLTSATEHEIAIASAFGNVHVPVIKNIHDLEEAENRLAVALEINGRKGWDAQKLYLEENRAAIQKAIDKAKEMGVAIPAAVAVAAAQLAAIDLGKQFRIITEAQAGVATSSEVVKNALFATATTAHNYTEALESAGKQAEGMARQTGSLAEKAQFTQLAIDLLTEALKRLEAEGKGAGAEADDLRERLKSLGAGAKDAAQGLDDLVQHFEKLGLDASTLTNGLFELDGAMSKLASTDIDHVAKETFKLSDAQQVLHDKLVALSDANPLLATTIGHWAALFREGKLSVDQLYQTLRDFLSSPMASLASPQLLGQIQALFSAFGAGAFDVKAGVAAITTEVPKVTAAVTQVATQTEAVLATADKNLEQVFNGTKAAISDVTDAAKEMATQVTSSFSTMTAGATDAAKEMATQVMSSFSEMTTGVHHDLTDIDNVTAAIEKRATEAAKRVRAMISQYAMPTQFGWGIGPRRGSQLSSFLDNAGLG